MSDLGQFTDLVTRGEECPGADIDVLVTVPLRMAERFAAALANATDRTVHLHAFASLPWNHPYHLCIRWLICRRLPTTFAQRGAVIRRIVRRDGSAHELAVPIERVAHFVPIDRPPPATPQAGSRFVASPTCMGKSCAVCWRKAGGQGACAGKASASHAAARPPRAELVGY